MTGTEGSTSAVLSTTAVLSPTATITVAPDARVTMDGRQIGTFSNPRMVDGCLVVDLDLTEVPW